MKKNLKDTLYAWLDHDYDLTMILRFLTKYSSKPKASLKVLDVGCGYGKKLKPMQDQGYDVLGVELNEDIVEHNQKSGLNCVTVDDFSTKQEKFDVLIMSHIIEHFQPDELIEFMDFYLDKLSVGGCLIVATPLPCNHFYADFTHVRPYWPVSINMIFSDHQTQIKYKSRNTLKLIDLKFRRRPYYPLAYRQRYWPRGTNSAKLSLAVDLISLMIFKISFHMIGVTDGWSGIFKKSKIKSNKKSA